MNVLELPLSQLREARWNPNSMEPAMLARLRSSIERFGLVVPLVVRPTGDLFEVLGGNQRLAVLRDVGVETAPCLIVELDDPHAMLLAQPLNHLRGEDDLGLRAALLRTVLKHLPERDLLDVLPESAEGLQQLASLGTQDMARYLEAWQGAQQAKLRHFTAQLTQAQWTLVDRVITGFAAEVSVGDQGNPNRTGLALVRLCEAYVRLRGAR